MITQYDVHALLHEELPQLALKRYTSGISLEIYALINCFTEFTWHAVDKHNYSLARKCFALAEKMYTEGDTDVKFIIENNFIYSFSSQKLHNRTGTLLISAVLPKRLFAVYKKKLMHAGNR